MLMRTPADPECFSDGNIAFLLYIPLSLLSSLLKSFSNSTTSLLDLEFGGFDSIPSDSDNTVRGWTAGSSPFPFSLFSQTTGWMAGWLAASSLRFSAHTHSTGSRIDLGKHTHTVEERGHA
jgi:hypothetical protein